MYNDTFDFYKVEKYTKHLDFNLLYNKIKQELHEEFQTSCNDWDKYDWANMIMDFYTSCPKLYLLEVYGLDIDTTFEPNVDEMDYITSQFDLFIEEKYES